MKGFEDPLFQSDQEMRLYLSKGHAHALCRLGINHRCLRFEIFRTVENLHEKRSLCRKRCRSRDVTTIQAEFRDLRSHTCAWRGFCSDFSGSGEGNSESTVLSVH